MQLRTRLVGLGLCIALLAILLSACSAVGKPNVVIMSPPSGSQYFEGEDIAVQSSASDSAGVVRVELVVDGTVARVDPSPTAQGQPNFTLIQTWKATTGVHTILVRAYNATGAVSDPAGVSVNVLQRIAQAPTLTPTIPSAPPPPGVTVTPSPVPPTLTPSPVPPVPGPGSCTNTAAFVQDVTVPDGTNWAPGQAFNKIWQVRNTGTCTWSGYQLVFASGEAMTTNSTAAVPSTVPGATADILVPMTAPSTSGAHAGQWRLKSPSGLFGSALTISINVVGGGAPAPAPAGCAGTPTIASFTSSAPSVTSGNPVTLNWGAVTNADSAEIDQGIGGIETPGSRTVNPTVYTTYTLTARCGANAATKQVTIAVLAAPAVIADLTVTNVEFNPTTPAPGASFQIKITIHNSGSVAASNFNVRALRQTVGAACPSGPGTVLFDRTTSVAGNANTVYTENASIAAANDYAICIILDHTNVIPEINENNNSLQRNLTVGLPDLHPDGMGMTGGWSPHAGTNVNVAITLRNDGDVAVSSFNVRLIQQTAAAACPGPGTVLFDRTAGPLAAHSVVAFNQTIQLAAGASRLCVYLDHMNNVTESNESNNTYQTPSFTVLP